MVKSQMNPVDAGWSRALWCAEARGWRLLACDEPLATDRYHLLDHQGRDLGALVAPRSVPAFGRNAPTVYLQRVTGGEGDGQAIARERGS